MGAPSVGSTPKLYRSRTDVQISGVCAGIAKYFGLEAIWVRLAFVVLALIPGPGILLYILLAILLPKEPLGDALPQGHNLEQTFREGAQNLRERAREVSQGGANAQLLGWAIVLVGAWFLLRNLGWLHVREDILWPLVLVGLGVAFLLRQRG